MSIVEGCPACGQMVRFPDDRGPLTLTCPVCKNVWNWTDNPQEQALTHFWRAKDKWEEARQIALRDAAHVIKLDPACPEAHLWRATLHTDAGQYVTAAEELEEAMRTNPELEKEFSPRIAELLVFSARLVDTEWVKTEADRLSQIECYAKAIRLDPSRSREWTPVLADLHIEQGSECDGCFDNERAVEHVLTAIRLDPGLPERCDKLGELLLRLTEDALMAHAYHRTISVADTAIQLGLENAEVYHCRGKANNSLGDYDRAIADLRKAVQRDIDLSSCSDFRKEMANAYFERGEQLRLAGAFEEAVEDFDTALGIRPRFEKAQNSKNTTLEAIMEEQKRAKQR